MKWYVAVLSKYAKFVGRARRKEYWYFILFNLIIIYALVLIEGAADTATSTMAGLYSFAVLVPALAVTARRLHDIGDSGWWTVAVFVPFLNLLLLVALMRASEPGQNKYGPNPLLEPEPVLRSGVYGR